MLGTCELTKSDGDETLLLRVAGILALPETRLRKKHPDRALAVAADALQLDAVDALAGQAFQCAADLTRLPAHQDGMQFAAEQLGVRE
jgi:hypothetical protein